MRRPMEIYDIERGGFVQGEFRPVRELANGAELGYFESSEYANTLAIMVLFLDGTYFIAERFQSMLDRPA
ncbi:MAG: hypothetical protein H6Q55_1817 [Deltaproteobacteria bacterium]|nr:hypothetical protein [Deltaproteobacteria bacterium]